MKHTIEITDVNFGYDKQLALENINLTYDSKDFLAIIGPNGGGKSTLLKLMLGLLTPQSGDIKLFGKKPQDVSKFIGYVPQNCLVNQSFPMRVIEVVLMGLIDKKMFGFYSKSECEIAMRSLEKVGMAHLSNQRIGELSGGQRQRVYIARALCANAKILMLDEPTASIDARGQAEIYTILKQINAQGIGIVLISHDINIALNFATKVAYVSKNLHFHDISPQTTKQDFIMHLAHRHSHFCDVEIALGECECNNKNVEQAQADRLLTIYDTKDKRDLKETIWRRS
ncbi:ABC transporter ATP-binding protein [Campylobacter sp. faydin G-105]|uniref:metal ABC transporter ATP-binding protein n=1 Tax=Campylobacter anatolicus TaxID=2829105 RepID=UPI001B97F790|nr:ABC transporter ATP-binding protein [Campylobacter anatolicus]MBR8461314.1 ABC transporter ATP-binding protein [Campylobacter anatolicus]